MVLKLYFVRQNKYDDSPILVRETSFRRAALVAAHILKKRNVKGEIYLFVSELTEPEGAGYIFEADDFMPMKYHITL